MSALTVSKPASAPTAGALRAGTEPSTPLLVRNGRAVAAAASRAKACFSCAGAL